MSHIHTGPKQHDATVSMHIIRYENGTPRAMLIMHKKLHSLMMAGGHVELNETPWSAVAHELEEETGYTLGDLMVLQPIDRMKRLAWVALHPQPFVSQTHWVVDEHFHTDLGYLFIANDEPRHEVAAGESTDIRWLTHDEIQELPDELIMPNIRETCDYIFTKLLHSNQWEKVPATDFSTKSPETELSDS